jgi:hypothetical protein
MRGHVIGGVVRLDEELPEGTEVEVTPVPPSAETEIPDPELLAAGFVPPERRAAAGTKRFQPITHRPPGVVEEFLEERR